MHETDELRAVGYLDCLAERGNPKVSFDVVVTSTINPTIMSLFDAAVADALAGDANAVASAIAGGRPMYERPDGRRFDQEHPEKVQEAAMLLDAASRLGEDGAYLR